ncbi:MAG: PAS domain S-box protein [Thermonemataceae bacterium]|nr:PAS domain S-box protein [Thermonemataceae bacterium]
MEKFKNLYIVGLVVLAVLILTGQAYIQFNINGNADDSKIVNLAGRQRALSENLAKDALLMSKAKSAEEFGESKKDLENKLKLWLLHHKALQIGDAQVINNPPKSPEISKAFSEIQPSLDALRENTETMLKMEYGANEQTMQSTIEEIVKHQADFFTKMNSLVEIYEKNFSDKQKTLSITALLIGVVIFILIIAFLFAMLIPALKRLEESNENITKANKQLEQSRTALQASAEEQLKANEELLMKQKEVETKNAALQKSEQETRELLEEQSKTNQKLALAQKELQKTLIAQNKINQELLETQEQLAKRSQEIEQSEREMRMLAETQLEANEKLLIAQRQVQENTALQKGILEAAALSIISTDTVGTITSINPTGLAWLQYTEDELVNKQSPAVFHEISEVIERSKVLSLQYQENIEPGFGVFIYEAQKGIVKPVEFTYVRKDGTKFPIALTASTIRNTQGQITGYLGIAEDITLRKKAEEEVRKSEQEMRMLAEAQLEANEKLLMAQMKEKQRQEKLEKFNEVLTKLSTTPLEKYGSLDEALKAITESTARALGIDRVSIWNYTQDKIYCQDLFEVSKNTHSQGTELFAKDFPKYFEAVAEGITINAANAHTHPNTAEFSEVYLKPLQINSMLDVPIRLGGELAGVVCNEYVGNDYKNWTLDEENFNRSIAEIVASMIEADKRLQTQKEFEQLFEASRDGLLLLDEKGFFKANSSAIEVYGCDSIDDLVGKTPIDYSPSTQNNGRPSGEEAMQYIQKAMQEGSALFEWTHNKKNGTIFPAEVLLSRVVFEGRNVLQATVRDISRRKKAEEEVRKSEQEMRMLAEAQLEANEKLLMAQKQIQENTALQRSILEAAALSIISTDTVGTITSINPTGLAWLQYTEEELVNKQSPAVFHEISEVIERSRVLSLQYQENVEPGFGVFTYEAQKGIVKPVEFTYVRKDGTKFPIALTVSAIRNTQGQITGYLGIAEDITLRKEAEKELQESLENQKIINASLALAQKELARRAEEMERSEREMRTLAEAQLEANEKLMMTERELKKASEQINLAIAGTNDGIWDWDIVKNAVYFSPRWKEMIGYEDHEIENSFDTFVNLQHPDDVGLINEKLGEYLSGKTDIYSVEFRMKTKSGEYKWIQARGLALRNEKGEPYRMAGSHSDINERRQAEENLKEALQKAKRAEEDMRMLAEAQLEANERLMMAEREAKEALQKAKKAEEDMRLLAEAQLEANEKLMLAEKNLKETLELEQKQKAELDRLVAQLKETQSQLVQNEKMASLGQLTAGIAHEINNPINFVYNGIDTLKISLDDLMEIMEKYSKLDDTPEHREELIEEIKELKEELDYEELLQDIENLVSDVKKGAVRTMEIVKGLRVFSRLDEEERKMASIKEGLESTLILLNNKIKNRVDLKTYYDESMPDILCYPGQLNQVFMNIISNAIQAIPEERKDGRIEIYTENMQEHVVIRIKDNGAGMSEQVKRRIFEPFFTTKAVGVGTGLGLSITFGIIEKHGGQIYVNSEEGKGTEFVIQLPKLTA